MYVHPLCEQAKDLNKSASILIGTSGWHYADWEDSFYPAEVKGYEELRYYSRRFATVENNSSFYRISKESTYKTWNRVTDPGFVFSLKLNQFMTHVHRLKLNDETIAKTKYVLESVQVLGNKLGALVIQLPAAFKCDPNALEAFLAFLSREIEAVQYKPDLAIEFRSPDWFNDTVFVLLRKYNVALVAANSSRYPGIKELTADIAYIRLHGPRELFASSYSTEELAGWARYIRSLPETVRKVYVYFNNTAYRYGLENAIELSSMLDLAMDNSDGSEIRKRPGSRKLKLSRALKK